MLIGKADMRSVIHVEEQSGALAGKLKFRSPYRKELSLKICSTRVNMQTEGSHFSKGMSGVIVIFPK